MNFQAFISRRPLILREKNVLNAYDGLVEQGMVSKETFATAADTNLGPGDLCNKLDGDEEWD